MSDKKKTAPVRAWVVLVALAAILLLAAGVCPNMWNLKEMIRMNLRNRKRFIDLENESVAAGGKGS